MAKKSTPKDPDKYDLVIIGSGPAGYRAAVQAAKFDKSVCMIEKVPEKLGGAWIHTGTIPSKTLRESMEAIHSIKFHAGSQWVDRVIQDMSTEKLLGRAKKVARFEEKLVRKYYDRYNIDVVFGYGTLDTRHSVRILCNDGGTRTVKADQILVCTGSRPRRPPNIPFDGWRVLDADDILNLECLPKSMLIYGGGVIGCEYACIFASLGVETTVVDGRHMIMQYVDQEVAQALKESMEDLGVKFSLGHSMSEIKVKGASVVMKLDNGKGMEGDVLFFAAGRTPNTEKLGFERLGIKVDDRGHVVSNEHFQTSIPNIYAAGDIVGSPALAATSASQGRHAVCHMFGKRAVAFPKQFPLGIYTIPELSSVGATEDELKQANHPYVVGRGNYAEVARGFIRGDDHGMLKVLVCANTHKILGIHIVGHDACNLIHVGLAYMQKGGHAQDLVDMVFNYPTLSEAYRIAAFNALNKIFPDGEIMDPPSEDEVPKQPKKVESA